MVLMALREAWDAGCGKWVAKKGVGLKSRRENGKTRVGGAGLRSRTGFAAGLIQGNSSLSFLLFFGLQINSFGKSIPNDHGPQRA